MSYTLTKNSVAAFSVFDRLTQDGETAEIESGMGVMVARTKADGTVVLAASGLKQISGCEYILGCGAEGNLINGFDLAENQRNLHTVDGLFYAKLREKVYDANTAANYAHTHFLKAANLGVSVQA